MKPDWKDLKYQKTCELPAAQLLQAEREGNFEKRVLKITDMVEKQLYKACKKQEAGTTVEYSLVKMRDSIDKFEEILMAFLGEAGISAHWTWDHDIKERVQANIIERLSEQNIDIRAVRGLYCVHITLP